MSSGQEAAKETKGALNDAYQATEDVRKNINSFADELLGGNKTHQSTGFSKDAKAVGAEIDKGLSHADAKASQSSGHTQ